ATHVGCEPLAKLRGYVANCAPRTHRAADIAQNRAGLFARSTTRRRRQHGPLRQDITTGSISPSVRPTTHRTILQHARHPIEPRETGPRLPGYASWAIPRR